jgi:hypothetical protein
VDRTVYTSSSAPGSTEGATHFDYLPMFILVGPVFRERPTDRITRFSLLTMKEAPMRRSYPQRLRLDLFSLDRSGGSQIGSSAREEEPGLLADLSSHQSESGIGDWERDWIDLGGEG